jgi:hypothetical protein
MNLLRESSKTIQIEAFHVFKLFVANQNKPSDIANILVANRNKLLRLLADIKPDKGIGLVLYEALYHQRMDLILTVKRVSYIYDSCLLCGRGREV